MEPQVSTDHWMILAEISGCREMHSIRYCRVRASCTIAGPKRIPMRKEDVIFIYLWQEVKKPLH